MSDSLPSSPSVIALKVNGVDREVKSHPDTPLLYALRNDLGLKGTLFGCGIGLCGSCFVLIDDHATPSCDTPVWAAAGKAITTIEGLADEGLAGPGSNSDQLSAIQRSFVDEQAGQCGYCLAGILISATAVIRKNPRASREEVIEALDRNLCRCGSQTRIIDAVMRVVSDT